MMMTLSLAYFCLKFQLGAIKPLIFALPMIWSFSNICVDDSITTRCHQDVSLRSNETRIKEPFNLLSISAKLCYPLGSFAGHVADFEN